VIVIVTAMAVSVPMLVRTDRYSGRDRLGSGRNAVSVFVRVLVLAIRTVFVLMFVSVSVAMNESDLRLTCGAPDHDASKDDEGQKPQSARQHDLRQFPDDEDTDAAPEVPLAHDGREQAAEADGTELLDVVFVLVVLMVVIVRHAHTPREISASNPKRGG
jgi:hypothetical protein